jgi:hypothetical protein
VARRARWIDLMDRSDGLVRTAAQKDGAVSTGTAGVAGVNDSEIDRRINDAQRQTQ